MVRMMQSYHKLGFHLFGFFHFDGVGKGSLMIFIWAFQCRGGRCRRQSHVSRDLSCFPSNKSQTGLFCFSVVLFHNSFCILVKMTRKDSMDFSWLSSLSFVLAQEAIRSAWLVASWHARKWDMWDSRKGSYDRLCSVCSTTRDLFEIQDECEKMLRISNHLVHTECSFLAMVKWVNQVSGNWCTPAMDDGKRTRTIESSLK